MEGLIDSLPDSIIIAVVIVVVFASFFMRFISLILKRNKRTARAERILSKSEWGDDNCQALVKGEISVGMTKEMVREALGPPSDIKQEWTWVRRGMKTEDYPEERWKYSYDLDANYVTFRDGKVSHIRQEYPFEKLVEKNCEPFSKG
jgi:hypothetical protein